MERTCNNCNLRKDISEFRVNRIYPTRVTYYAKCKSCIYETSLSDEKLDIRLQNLQKKELGVVAIPWNKSSAGNIWRREYNRKRRQKRTPVEKLRANISRTIGRILSTNGGSKNGISCLEKLGYSIEELKTHLESQFESWMSWSNYGLYQANSWNDVDQSTWTWNLDHIVPQSFYSYSSMNDDDFKSSWALSNLRPLSAKQNF